MKPASRAVAVSATLTAAALTFLAGPAAVSAQAATRPTRTTTASFKLSYSSHAGFYLRAAGTASGPAGRTVKFQRWTGKSWVTIATGRTNRYHRYQLNTVSTFAGRFKLHVYVPVSGSYKSVSSASAYATTKRNSTTAALKVPTSVTWGGKATLTFAGTTTEARRNVFLQKWSAGAWHNVTWKTVGSTAVKGTTTRRLSTSFAVAAPSWGTAAYRTVVTTTALSSGAYSASGSNTVQLAAPRTYNGQAFDACYAPTADKVAAWAGSANSPYGAAGLYLGGPNQLAACTKDAAWAAATHAAGIELIPIYVGAQSSCWNAKSSTAVHITAANAASLGASEGADAVAKAAAFGVRPGSALYLDIENFNPANSACAAPAVLSFVQAWDLAVHQRGYWAGLYANAMNGLSTITSSTGANLPDVIWYANWNGANDTVTGLPSGFPASRWPAGWITHQYQGGHSETHNGVTITIDTDLWNNAPVAVIG